MNKSATHPHVWARLAAFDHPAPATALVAFLEKHGFTVRLYDERKLQRYWFLARQLAGMCVQVPEETLPAVRDFLAAQPEAESLLRTAIRCPSCHSTRVHYPQMTRKNVMPTVVAHFLVAVRLMRHQCYCEDCHFAWARGSGSGRGTRGEKVPLFSSQR